MNVDFAKCNMGVGCIEHGICYSVSQGRPEMCPVPAPCATFMGGLDDGPWLPGKGPRKRQKPKSAEELRAIRAKGWATRRARQRVRAILNSRPT